MKNESTSIRFASPEELDRLENLWKALYEHQTIHGMQIQLPANVFPAWVSGIAPLLGRFAFVVVAEDQGAFVGFVAGRVRMLPPHFGLERVGFIGEVFVAQERRSQRLGERLLARAVEWYRENNVQRVELQVVADNPDGLRFYERLGWRRELVQLTFDTRQA